MSNVTSLGSLVELLLLGCCVPISKHKINSGVAAVFTTFNVCSLGYSVSIMGIGVIHSGTLCVLCAAF